MPSMPQWLYQRAQLTPHRLAFETEHEKLSFQQLYVHVQKTASALRSAGVVSGAYIASLQGNTIRCAILTHALMMAGAVMVPLNTRLSVDELTQQIQDSGSQMLITDESNEEKAIKVGEKTSCTVLHISALFTAKTPLIDFSTEVQLNEPCTVIFTSGTTGRPKGVVLTYGNHWWNANASLLNLGLTQKDTWLCCVPLFHVSGLSILMKSVIYGMPVYLCEKFSPETVNHQITKGGISHISVVAPMLQRMMDALGEGKTYPSTLRCILLGGGPVPQHLLQRCLGLHMPIYQTYGMSETASQSVTLPPESMLEKAGSAGKPLFPMQIRIISDGHSAAVDEPGEIQVKGPTVFSHYLNNADATKQAFEDQWFLTGDIGYLDDDGFLFVLDRRKDLIISGGENIYPAEVESILNGFEGVQRAGVIGIPDTQWGHVPIAFVSLRHAEQFSEHALIDYCRGHLAHYKVPKRIYVIDQLPENASHKLLRRKLFAYYKQMNNQ
ncbi:o-succinylbenzoate--CoA ligase [Sporolactobacillus kofuensis]|uniref:2-succinylbenzoate--CoA ligase n=1 Tax=Sporolactobacillus kofuensis TaxID=269672 RepID=A0ABW1WC56_9BACL|nr:o-succinylbenzoate--CoA ligase [Sporolactobacillus kofuensis]MCO7175092.1 o-succinylbenzoate--CoA ligase [Sporolactobacillus kofuensis]